MYTYQEAFAMNVGHPEGRVIARLQLMRELERGERIRSVARRYKMSPNTVRRWWRRYQEEGVAGLRDRSRRPKRSPNRTPAEVEEKIKEVALDYPSWGCERIAGELRLRMGIKVSMWTVRHVLRRFREAGELPARRVRGKKKSYRDKGSVQEWRKKHGLEDAVWIQVDRKNILGTRRPWGVGCTGT